MYALVLLLHPGSIEISSYCGDIAIMLERKISVSKFPAFVVSGE
jgi:hypothetical protein